MRRKLMDILETKDGDIVYDSTSIDWSKFEWSQGYYTHYITKNEILKPYLIPYAYYKDVQYEDIILLLNGVEDIWEVIPESEFRIPKLNELQDFIQRNTK